MARSFALVRVAVPVRAAGRVWWWLGVLSAAVGVFVPGFTGRRIGLLAGAAAFLVAAAVAFLVRRKRYGRLAAAASRAGKSVILQDRAVTVRVWRRDRRWWFPVALVLAIGSSAGAPATAGLLLAGVGAGLWLKAVGLGRWERAHGVLLWVRPEFARRSPAAAAVPGWLTTGPAAGDARPGGARRRALARV
ncbi:hypothetical protein [Streptantibioticus silvisoli]|uniref:Integral membrane protein n=1 Tax=Streptantibioticus silvisoli TaxID=2705255 RepID=A0ABT6W3F0_9ACTN|nr:hypothetical protein [Streptantibioticus silvisoli]MDI5965240.1 hypothetical protein [Streptantibioticus silvisoli]